MFRKIAFLSICLSLCSMAKAQGGSTYWYANGIPDVWFYQPDVFAFRCFNGSAFTGTLDPSVVDSVVHHAGRSDKAVEVYFNPNASPTDILDEIQNMWNTGQIEMPYLTLTKNPAAPRTAEQWFTADNVLLVSFTDPYPDPGDLANFMAVLGLTPCHTPSPDLPVLAQGPSYYHAFYVNPDPDGMPYSADYFAEIARQAYNSFNGFVAGAEPNMVNNRIRTSPYSASPFPAPMASAGSQCQTNDPFFPVLNHIQNTGTTSNIPNYIPGFGPLGTAGADANICGCWEQGLSGNGVKVAIVGFDPFYTEDPDLQSPYDYNKMWDCSGISCVPAYQNWNLPVWNSWGTDESRAMAYILAADANNGIGSVGVSPNVTIYSYMLNEIDPSNMFSSWSTLSVVNSIQQALADGADILVLDFWGIVDAPSVSSEILKFNAQARSPYRGVTIAPAGGEPSYTGNPVSVYNSSFPMYPAAYPTNPHHPEVIGVIGSNRHDLRMDWEAVTLMAYGYAQAFNWGSVYDVAAPGPSLPYPDYYDISNPNSYHFIPLRNGYKGSLATVVGVCALLMEYNPVATDYQIRQALFLGAEKVGPYSYTNGGKSEELGYGRVDCGNAITHLNPNHIGTVGATIFSVLYEPGGWLVRTNKPETKNYRLSILDVGGKRIASFENNGRTDVFIKNDQFPQGIYFLQLTDEESGNLGSMKLLKY